MEKSPAVLYKTLVIVVIVLFTGMSVVSSTGSYIKGSHTNLDNQVWNPTIINNNDTTPPVTNISLNGTISEFGFFSSEVEVTLNATDDLSGVNVTYYDLDMGGDEIYYEPFMIIEHGNHILDYHSVDNAGNVEKWKIKYILIDLLPPEIRINWLILDNNKIKFIPGVSDDGSGVYKVEYYINNKFMYTAYYYNNYEWIWIPKWPGWYSVSCIVYDKVGLTGQDYVDIHIPRNRVTYNSLFFRFLERFQILRQLL